MRLYRERKRGSGGRSQIYIYQRVYLRSLFVCMYVYMCVCWEYTWVDWWVSVIGAKSRENGTTALQSLRWETENSLSAQTLSTEPYPGLFLQTDSLTVCKSPWYHHRYLRIMGAANFTVWAGFSNSLHLWALPFSLSRPVRLSLSFPLYFAFSLNCICFFTSSILVQLPLRKRTLKTLHIWYLLWICFKH